jgi:hypothetical protein
VVPYSSQNKIEKYRKKEIYASPLIRELSKNRAFRESMGGKYDKQLALKKYLKGFLNKYTVGPSVSGGLVALGLKDEKQPYYYGDQ